MYFVYLLVLISPPLVVFSFTEVCEDLTAIALKYGPVSVSAAVSCMSTLAGNASKDCTPLVQLAQKCFFSMAAVARQQLLDKNPLPPAQVLIGLLNCCY